MRLFSVYEIYITNTFSESVREINYSEKMKKKKFIYDLELRGHRRHKFCLIRYSFDWFQWEFYAFMLEKCLQ